VQNNLKDNPYFMFHVYGCSDCALDGKFSEGILTIYKAFSSSF